MQFGIVFNYYGVRLLNPPYNCPTAAASSQNEKCLSLSLLRWVRAWLTTHHLEYILSPLRCADFPTTISFTVNASRILIRTGIRRVRGTGRVWTQTFLHESYYLPIIRLPLVKYWKVFLLINCSYIRLDLNLMQYTSENARPMNTLGNSLSEKKCNILVVRRFVTWFPISLDADISYFNRF